MADSPRWQTLPEPALMPKPDVEGYAPVNGIRMYYAVFNAHGADPVILLHGGMGTAANWGNQVPALMGRQRVIVTDARGHGRSTRTDAAFSYRDMALDVVALLGQLGVARAALVGWSDGGIVALQVAITGARLAALGGRSQLESLWPQGSG